MKITAETFLSEETILALKRTLRPNPDTLTELEITTNEALKTGTLKIRGSVSQVRGISGRTFRLEFLLDIPDAKEEK
ncbi:MAG: hypothetical protein A2847_01030 [Candidatus Sungbacteria bacterium RIFCSPHIGHO2_01_FULL_50_25]|uniref:Uncharacterized protein n=1 Tax=Candidatus Sungbacteria bacterium RIFCSPHIGHO2_01_FULL_50_25 TaxID=1802265 RepID=A0A1G2K7X3_9BACT|nr:MAG: hypothetical protein A2847_01030 [Candidatus Sungbacteria bacterium RIFCSPHIGHO2_01_FULL_50_25]